MGHNSPPGILAVGLRRKTYTRMSQSPEVSSACYDFGNLEDVEVARPRATLRNLAFFQCGIIRRNQRNQRPKGLDLRLPRFPRGGLLSPVFLGLAFFATFAPLRPLRGTR